MLRQIGTVMRYNRNTLVQDMVGASALVVMLLVALHLPGMI